jgi:uncharacterized membrane protein YgdD (TMEM256/DUF423 family)
VRPSLLAFCAASGALTTALSIALLAIIAHAPLGDEKIDTAVQFLFVQGPAIMAGSAIVAAGLAHRRFAVWCLLVVLIGLFLFCGDLGLRGARIGRFFPMAAPIGGMLMIAGWLGFALALLIRRR